MGSENPKQAIAAFRQMMKEMELKNPMAVNRYEEIDVLSHSVNPVRLKNNPIILNEKTISHLYNIIVK